MSRPTFLGCCGNAEQVFGQTQSFVSDVAAIACDRMRSHEIACDRMQSHEIANLMSTTVRVLDNTSGTRSGTESLPKCFFTTTVNRFHLLFFSPFSKRKKWEAGLILHSKTCFFCSQLSWRNTSGRIFSPVSPKQVPNVFLPGRGRRGWMERGFLKVELPQKISN